MQGAAGQCGLRLSGPFLLYPPSPQAAFLQLPIMRETSVWHHGQGDHVGQSLAWLMSPFPGESEMGSRKARVKESGPNRECHPSCVLWSRRPPASIFLMLRYCLVPKSHYPSLNVLRAVPHEQGSGRHRQLSRGAWHRLLCQDNGASGTEEAAGRGSRSEGAWLGQSWHTSAALRLEVTGDD